jgi:hypothetical protein
MLTNPPFYIFIIECRAVFVLPRSGSNGILEFYPAFLEGYSAHSKSLSSALLAVSNQSTFYFSLIDCRFICSMLWLWCRWHVAINAHISVTIEVLGRSKNIWCYLDCWGNVHRCHTPDVWGIILSYFLEGGRQWRTQKFFSGVSTNSVEGRGQRERRSGGGSPLVRGSTQFANKCNPYSY